uniref:Uncharacterized protein n=1 Tax=Guillardia theta TaxID=55529 RepID=A0A7S4UK51_GUITH|mmetsp:Transcript_44348/g.139930  ORF Transcript_44348/g.139930 Transcript_44348/m.139930 type:complete len:258 (+) Transcript_44348:188-961(+)
MSTRKRSRGCPTPRREGISSASTSWEWTGSKRLKTKKWTRIEQGPPSLLSLLALLLLVLHSHQALLVLQDPLPPPGAIPGQPYAPPMGQYPMGAPPGWPPQPGYPPPGQYGQPYPPPMNGYMGHPQYPYGAPPVPPGQPYPPHPQYPPYQQPPVPTPPPAPAPPPAPYAQPEAAAAQSSASKSAEETQTNAPEDAGQSESATASSAPIAQMNLVYDDEDFCMEERRASLSRYSFDENKQQRIKDLEDNLGAVGSVLM